MANDAGRRSKSQKKADRNDKKAPAPKKFRFFQRSECTERNDFRSTWDEAGKGLTEEERKAAKNEGTRPTNEGNAKIEKQRMHRSGKT